MKSLFALLALTAATNAAPAFKPLEEPAITYNKAGYYELHDTEGGRLSSFDAKFREVERSGLEIRVKGICGSACTIVLRNRKACAEQAALLGFHQALKPRDDGSGLYEYAPNGTSFLWNWVYPEIVKAKLGQLTPQMVWIKGHEIMPRCK